MTGLRDHAQLDCRIDQRRFGTAGTEDFMEVSLTAVQEAVAAAYPDRDCIISSRQRLTYGQFNERTRRLGNYLVGRGLGLHTDRADLSGWESGQDHLAIYMYNRPEYLEAMYGAYKARTAPFNVNYRYVEEELVYLFRDSGARAVVYEAAFAPMVEHVRRELGGPEVLIQVSDDSGNALIDGAVEYEAALASASAEPPVDQPKAEDLYILYTGGTTGMPKGVLWRQSDIYFAALGGAAPGGGAEHESLESVVSAAASGIRVLPSPPFMHGAAHWASMNAFHTGGTVVIQDDTQRLVPTDIWNTVQTEGAQVLLIVGDAFARPLLDELEKTSWDLSSLIVLVSGGAALNVTYKEAFLDKLPQLMILDGIGSSETGSQAANMSTRDGGASTGTFQPTPGNCVIDEDMGGVLPEGSEDIGWFARAGRVPLGYLGDEAKTAKTFPTIDGVRFSVPGDRARQLAGGAIEVLGRDSVTINSGGEKIFAEEVEQAIKHHEAIYDAVCVGRPSERWGNEVVAIVALREGYTATADELRLEAEKHIARYKLPKEVIFLDEVLRSPSGKADYRWAKEIATKGQA